jgi:hypothetical protein
MISPTSSLNRLATLVRQSISSANLRLARPEARKHVLPVEHRDIPVHIFTGNAGIEDAFSWGERYLEQVDAAEGHGAVTLSSLWDHQIAGIAQIDDALAAGITRIM